MLNLVPDSKEMHQPLWICELTERHIVDVRTSQSGRRICRSENGLKFKKVWTSGMLRRTSGSLM